MTSLKESMADILDAPAEEKEAEPVKEMGIANPTNRDVLAYQILQKAKKGHSTSMKIVTALETSDVEEVQQGTRLNDILHEMRAKS